MAAQREWILRRAPMMMLRTAPVDPDDLMRGAYSQLAYDINRVPKELWADGLKTWVSAVDRTDYRREKSYRDTLVYATLSMSPDGVSRVVALSDQKPTSGLFIRGRVNDVSPRALRVRYGIEAYFSDKQVAVKLDQERRNTHRGVPSAVDVAVAPSGLAVLKSLTWEPLGIAIRIRRESRPLLRDGVEQAIQVPTAIEVEIKNHSDKPVGLVMRPGGRSFRLIAVDDEQEQEYHWVNQGKEMPVALASDVSVLAPGETHREVLSVDDPYWALNYNPRDKDRTAGVTSLDKIENQWGAVFRLEYVPGPGSETLSGAVPVRPQPLLSARWWPNGQFD